MYEFNTTDEHGDEIMDKMSREETLQIMKDIHSQYKDAVIAEFSGDGMATLVEGRKGALSASMNKPGSDIKVLGDLRTALIFLIVCSQSRQSGSVL